ncbi:hypothetical protein HOE67_00555 [Candidatus Peregrinibacteria bacterium]|jgi:hypothetical protein|nr:hypothetical protein [Candidatus Peregrinibacteria bacterium]MBT4055580.1 hypothetical protein [Candidatus Peregrinibacteria bacterium]
MLTPGQNVLYTGPTVEPPLHARNLLRANIRPGTAMVVDEVREDIAVIKFPENHIRRDETYEVPLLTLTTDRPEEGDNARYIGETMLTQDPSDQVERIDLVNGAKVLVIFTEGDTATIKDVGRYEDPAKPNVTVDLKDLLKIPNKNATPAEPEGPEPGSFEELRTELRKAIDEDSTLGQLPDLVKKAIVALGIAVGCIDIIRDRIRSVLPLQ